MDTEHQRMSHEISRLKDVEQKLAELRTTEGNVQLSQFNHSLLSFRIFSYTVLTGALWWYRSEMQ